MLEVFCLGSLIAAAYGIKRLLSYRKQRRQTTVTVYDPRHNRTYTFTTTSSWIRCSQERCSAHTYAVLSARKRCLECGHRMMDAPLEDLTDNMAESDLRESQSESTSPIDWKRLEFVKWLVGRGVFSEQIGNERMREGGQIPHG